MTYSEAISMAIDSVSEDNNLDLDKRKEIIDALIEAEGLANFGYTAKKVFLTENKDKEKVVTK